jgi:hypothetical protein
MGPSLLAHLWVSDDVITRIPHWLLGHHLVKELLRGEPHPVIFALREACRCLYEVVRFQ